MGLGGAAAAWTPDEWTGRLEDWTADDVLTSGAAVTAFVTQCTGGHNAVQANASYQGVLGTGANGHPVVAVTAPAYQYYVFTNAAPASADVSVMAVYKAPDVTTTYQPVVDFGANGAGTRKLCRHSGAAGNTQAYYDGTNVSGMGANVATVQSTAWVHDSTNTAKKMYRAGAEIGTAANVGSAAGGSATCLIFGDRDNVAAFHMAGSNEFYRTILLDRAATAGDRTNWFGWSLGRYGV